MIIKKSAQEIAILRENNRIIAQLFENIAPMIKPGVSTAEIDRECEMFIRAHDAVPSFKGYHGFPGTICASINEVIVHGIPGERKLKEGDIFSVDVGAYKNGFHSDSARTFAVGKVSKLAQRLMDVTEQSLYAAIEQAVPGNRLSDIGHAVQQIVEKAGFSVIRDFVGHGIGRALHEDPQIPNFGAAGKGPLLEEGMVFAIEPMVSAGSWRIKILKDEWTAVTADKSLSAHFEHSIAITKGEALILSSL